jgi:hypothetical protein
MTTDEKLDELRNTLSKVLSRMDTHDERHKAIEEKLSDHAHDLYGNGGPGLKAQVQTQRIICESNRALHAKPNMLHVWAFDVSKNIAAALVVLFVGWLLFVYRHMQ